MENEDIAVAKPSWSWSSSLSLSMDSEPLGTPQSRVLLGLGGEVHRGRPGAALATLRNGWWRSWDAVHLCRGSLWKHLSRKSLPSSERSSGRGGSSSEQAIFLMIEAKESGKSTQGGHPWHISTTVQPRDQISEAKLCSTPCNASGAIQNGVPLKSEDEEELEVPLASILVGSCSSTESSSTSFDDSFLAKPKSAIFTDSEEEPTKMFCAFMSQWMISCAWRYVKPSTTSLVNLRTYGKINNN